MRGGEKWEVSARAPMGHSISKLPVGSDVRTRYFCSAVLVLMMGGVALPLPLCPVLPPVLSSLLARSSFSRTTASYLPYTERGGPREKTRVRTPGGYIQRRQEWGGVLVCVWGGGVVYYRFLHCAASAVSAPAPCKSWPHIDRHNHTTAEKQEKRQLHIVSFPVIVRWNIW